MRLMTNGTDPGFAAYLPRYGGDQVRAWEGLVEDRRWARFIRAHEFNRGWRAWAECVLALDPDWISGRLRACTCKEFAHEQYRH